MYEDLYAAGREIGLDVDGEISAALIVLLQHCIKVRDSESPDEQVRLFACAELSNPYISCMRPTTSRTAKSISSDSARLVVAKSACIVA